MVPCIDELLRHRSGQDFGKSFDVASIQHAIQLVAKVLPQAAGLDQTDTLEGLTFRQQGDDMLAGRAQ